MSSIVVESAMHVLHHGIARECGASSGVNLHLAFLRAFETVLPSHFTMT